MSSPVIGDDGVFLGLGRGLGAQPDRPRLWRQVGLLRRPLQPCPSTVPLLCSLRRRRLQLEHTDRREGANLQQEVEPQRTERPPSRLPFSRLLPVSSPGDELTIQPDRGRRKAFHDHSAPERPRQVSWIDYEATGQSTALLVKILRPLHAFTPANRERLAGPGGRQ